MEELFVSAEECFAHKRILPGLILVYSAMDILASLSRPAHRDEAGRRGFIEWVKIYLLPGSKLTCTPEDLYGARCGLLHTYSAESRFSHEGKARQVYYAWGTADAEDLDATVGITSFRNLAVAVHIDELLIALKSGFQKFMKDVANDPERGQLVRMRVGKIFGPVPLELVAEAADLARGRSGNLP